MKTKLVFDRLFVYSESSNKYFNAEFSNGLNIVYGKNTSGKSTLFHSILYTMGINENNKLLDEILEYGVIFRLDCTIFSNSNRSKIYFIRENETLTIKTDNEPFRKFIGISGNNSGEHIRLKDYISKLFGFNLKLEQKGVMKNAPLEAMVLPYYVSQSVGWVYLRKSFGNLDFFKNFREDYLDYYTGINSFVDREKKTELECELRQIKSEIDFYTNMKDNNKNLSVAKLLDETYLDFSIEYIEEYSNRKKELIDLERKYTAKCNDLSFQNKRLMILRKVSKNHKTQAPEEGKCPTCSQNLPHNLSAWYKYYQEKNNTEIEMKKCNEVLKSIKSDINSLKKKIEFEKIHICKQYNVLRERDVEGMSVDTWLDNKTNVKLAENCDKKLGQLITTQKRIEEDLKEYKTDKEVQAERNNVGKEFSRLFQTYLSEMEIRNLNDRRYNSLFEITAFPFQGVELHKTIMAYHFAFNKFIKHTEYVHRLPFMLDAIFKEDIERDNKRTILDFIAKNRPMDTQSILSIAETINDNGIIKEYNETHFSDRANLICIGNSSEERAFLSDYDEQFNSYVEETIEWLCN